MEKKTVLIKDLLINFDLPQCNLPNEVFTKAINFTCVNGKFVTTNESAPAPVASEKGPWSPLPTGLTAVYASLLYHFDAFPFVESTGALISQAAVNLPVQLATSGQTFGAGAFIGSHGEGHVEYGGSLYVTYLTEDPNHAMQPNFTIRFRYTPTVDTAGGVTFVLDVESPIAFDNYTNSSFSVFRGFPNAVVAMSAGTTYAISIEAYNNNGYFYVDGVLVHTFIDLAANCYANYSYLNPLILDLGHTINDVGVAPIFDEFLFVNGTALAAGASSYQVETVPFTGVIYV